jgi:hypothetical protein
LDIGVFCYIGVLQLKEHPPEVWHIPPGTLCICKKDKLNKELYNIHLKAAQEWGNSWYLILDSIHESINQEMEKKYKNINQQMTKLGKQKQTNIHPRTSQALLPSFH